MPVNIALTAFDVCALILVIGLLACRLAVLPGNREDVLRLGMLRLSGTAVLLLTLSSAGILASRTLELAGGAGGFFANLATVVKLTHYGHVWVWRIPALASLWLAWLWSRRASRASLPDWIMLLAAVAVALTRSETGHPADQGDFTAGVWVDWVHLVSAAVWVGSLFGMSLVVFPRLLRIGAAANDLAAPIFQRLSTLAGGALAFVLAAGIYSAVGQLGSFPALWTSSYGVALDAKMSIVVVMIAIGAHNRYVKLPRLLSATQRPRRHSPLRNLIEAIFRPRAVTPAVAVRSCARAVLVESLLGLAAIAAASVLLHQMPPADMPRHSRPMSVRPVSQPRSTPPAQNRFCEREPGLLQRVEEARAMASRRAANPASAGS